MGLESNAVVPGGGAVETALSLHLDNFSRTFESYEQWAISEYADALQTIPKTLAMNAAKDAVDLLATLRVQHHASQQPDAQPEQKEYRFHGLDLTVGTTKN